MVPFFIFRARQYLFVPAKYKDCYLAYVLNELSGLHGIIFVSTCSTAQRLYLMLRTLGYSVACLHGQMPQVCTLAWSLMCPLFGRTFTLTA